LKRPFVVIDNRDQTPDEDDVDTDVDEPQSKKPKFSKTKTNLFTVDDGLDDVDTDVEELSTPPMPMKPAFIHRASLSALRTQQKKKSWSYVMPRKSHLAASSSSGSDGSSQEVPVPKYWLDPLKAPSKYALPPIPGPNYVKVEVKQEDKMPLFSRQSYKWFNKSELSESAENNLLSPVHQYLMKKVTPLQNAEATPAAFPALLSQLMRSPNPPAPMVGTTRQIAAYDALLRKHPEAYAKWNELRPSFLTEIPDPDPLPEASSNYGYQQPYRPYASGTHIQSRTGSIHNLSVEEEEAIKGVFDGLENYRSMNEAEQPRGLTVNLLKHQRQGLLWMTKQEEGSHKGGILADEMGLGKTIQSIALMLHNKPTTRERRQTLIVAPLAVMKQWHSEIEEKTLDGSFKILLYHGTKSRSRKIILEHDVIITTYGVLGGEMPKEKRKTSKAEDEFPEFHRVNQRWGPLFQIEWFRVILDEAHSIKNKGTASSKAAAELKAERRWCLSGTPIQNNMDDIFSLYRFLRIKPYCDYKFFKANLYQGKDITKAGFGKLQALIRGTLLRRTKTTKIDGKPILNLPERIVNLESNQFSESERDFYDSLEKKAVIKFNAYLKEGTVMHNYSNILVLLLRLRQACNHPYLIKAAKDLADATGATEDMDVEKAPILSVVGDQFVVKVVEGKGKEKEKAADNPQDEDDVVARIPNEVLVRLATTPADAECPICYDVLMESTLYLSRCLTGSRYD